MQRLIDWVRRRLLRYFVAGVFAILPVVVTVAVVIWVARFLEQFVGPERSRWEGCWAPSAFASRPTRPWPTSSAGRWCWP